MGLIPLVELSVAEAHEILSSHFQVPDLPPLVSVENEDWGRDYLLTKLFDMPRDALARAGLSPDDPPPLVWPEQADLAWPGSP
jgi:hypothetical protein